MPPLMLCDVTQDAFHAMWHHSQCVSHCMTSPMMFLTLCDVTLNVNLFVIFFSFSIFFLVSHHFTSNVKWCDDKRFKLDPPNLFIQNLIWNAQTSKMSWIMRFGENEKFFNTPWWWSSIPRIVVLLWWTPSFAHFVIALVVLLLGMVNWLQQGKWITTWKK